MKPREGPYSGGKTSVARIVRKRRLPPRKFWDYVSKLLPTDRREANGKSA